MWELLKSSQEVPGGASGGGLQYRSYTPPLIYQMGQAKNLSYVSYILPKVGFCNDVYLMFFKFLFHSTARSSSRQQYLYVGSFGLTFAQ